MKKPTLKVIFTVSLILATLLCLAIAILIHKKEELEKETKYPLLTSSLIYLNSKVLNHDY